MTDDLTAEESATLRRLAAEADIRRVVLTYPRGIDRGNGEMVSSIYHEDALDYHGPFGVGLGVDFGPHVEENLERDGRFFTLHFMGDTFFEFDATGDVAHTETYVRANHGVIREGEPHLELFFGRYLDRFERRDGVWKIAQRITMRDYMCSMPVTPMMRERRFQGTRDATDASFAHLRLERLSMEE